MILERLEMERVRRFTPDFACTFEPGLNAVVGTNESGKSTIFKALEAALFWDPTSTREEVRSLYAWGDDRLFALRLYFCSGDFRYRLSKDFHAKKLLLEEQPTGKVWQDAKSAHSHIWDLLGLKSLELFSASAAVAQGRLSVPEGGRDRKALEEALAEALTGGANGGGVSRAIELLSKDIQRLTVGLKDKAYKTPGPIKAAEERLADLHRRHHAASTVSTQRVSHLQALNAAERELVEVTENLEAKRALLDVEAERRQTEQALQEHKKRYREVDERHRALEENAKRLEAFEEALGRVGSTAHVGEESLQALRAAMARWDVLSGPLEEASRAVQETKVPSPWGALALGAFGIAAPLLTGAASPWASVKAASLALGAVTLLTAGWLWYRRQIAVRLLGERRAEAARREAELRELEVRIGELSGRAGSGSPEEILRGAEEAARGLKERDRLLSKRDGLLGGQSAEALEADRGELLRKMGVLERRLGEERFLGPALDAERFAALRGEVETLAPRREELVRQIERLRGGLDISAEGTDELAELQEAIESAERELHRHRRCLQVRELTKAVLEEAHQAAMTPAAELFQQLLGRHLSSMSGGRYTRVRLEGGLGGLEVLGPEREDFVRPQELSFGTAEQLLLAARLTLVELLAGGKKPPFLLDEPFGAFDEERLRATMELLSSIARERQVVLFTHQEAVASACDHVVALPTPGGGA